MTHHCEDIRCRVNDARGCAADEHRLALLLSDILTLANAGSFRSAARRFADLRLTLEQEMEEMEARTLPQLLSRCGPRVPLPDVCGGHRLLHAALNAVGDALSESDASRVVRNVAELNSSLTRHRAAEHRELARLVSAASRSVPE